MSKLKQYVEEIYRIADNDPVSVYEKYFAEDAVVVDLDGSKTQGRAKLIAKIQDWGSKLIKVHKSEVIDYVLSGDEQEGTVISIWDYHFEHQEWGTMNYKQASVTKWREGKVIHEQYFGNPQG